VAGRLDLAIGRVADPVDRAAIAFTPLDSEPVALIVRRDHPLTRRAKVSLADLSQFDWVLPGADSPLGAAVLGALARVGAVLPRQQLATASFLLTLTMVQQTNAIAPLARAVATAFADRDDAPFRTLDVGLAIDVGPYGLMRRKGQTDTPALARLAALVERPVGAD
jgi:DNA-binding transcriptional LysR family regulator